MHSQPKHSPLPWTMRGYQPSKNELLLWGEDKDHRILASLIGPDRHANASIIVRAVNSHEELITAALGLLNAFHPRLMRTGCNSSEELAIKALKQAITKAEAPCQS